jgi:hypothetical protein
MTTTPIKFKTYEEAYEYASKEWEVAFKALGELMTTHASEGILGTDASEKLFEELYKEFPILKIDGPDYVDSLVED